jgi:predicted ArsR family transcriptional regulator
MRGGDNRLLSILRDSERSFTRSEISEALGRHTPSEVISRTLNSLRAKRLVRAKQRKTAGRSAEVWRAATEEEGEQ